MTAELVRLQDLVDRGDLVFNDGYRTKATELGESGYPILRVAEVLDGRLASTFADHVRPEYAPKIGAKLSQPGDVVVTTKGTVGRVARVPRHSPTFVYSPQVCFFRPVGSVVDSCWLYYWFHTAEFTSQARGIQAQTDMAAYINLADMRRLWISLPPGHVQREIAATLGALDDKIESNRRLVAVSVKLIRLWVTQGLDCGSSTLPVSGLAKFVNGGAYTKGATGSGRMVIRIAELTGGPGGSTVYNDLDVPDDRVARPGDLLMSWSGSLDVHRWVLDEAIINQHIFKVLPDALPPWLVFDRLKMVMPVFQSIARDKATTMGHIQRGHLESTKVPMPSGDAIARLQLELDPLWERVLLTEQESRKLVQLRDVLLPELMSGRIRVPEAEEAVSEVL